jgi:hypothetical protein
MCTCNFSDKSMLTSISLVITVANIFLATPVEASQPLSTNNPGIMIEREVESLMAEARALMATLAASSPRNDSQLEDHVSGLHRFASLEEVAPPAMNVRSTLNLSASQRKPRSVSAYEVILNDEPTPTAQSTLRRRSNRRRSRLDETSIIA